MRSLPALTVALALALSGCGGDDPAANTPNDPNANSEAALPAGLFLGEAPAGALDVAKAKTDALEGQEIVIRGRIGGTEHPFTKGRAILTLADAQAILACGEGSDDGCTTPWDYCCESAENKIANTATVQIVGADGKPLAAGLEGVRGLKPLATLVVKGKVRQFEAGKVLVVDAEGIYLER